MNELPWEDNLLERKVESDLKDILKTLVAFANSVRPGHIAVLLIGEKDDGIVAGVTNPDNIQKRVREEYDKIYPDILWRSTIYQKEGKHCVRVEIEYSGNTPHFGGPACIRKGSETIRGLSSFLYDHRWPMKDTIAILRSVNMHWITLEKKTDRLDQSEPLEKLTLTFDDERKQLKIIVSY